MDILINLLSETIAFVLGVTLSAAWRWLSITPPVRSFWRAHPSDKIIIAVSLAEADPHEHTINVPTGDTLAFGEIAALLRRHYPKAEIKFHRSPERPISYEDEWNGTVVLIGGGKSNLTTRCILAALEPPLYGRDHEHPEHDFKGLRNKEGRVVRQPIYADDGRLLQDYAYVIRAPNPYHQEKSVFILVGGYSHGTYGAAHWVAQSRDLAWLWQDGVRHSVADFIRGRSKTDSIQVLLSVPTEGIPSEVEFPMIGQVQVWHEEGGKMAYYFNAPSKSQYQAAYKRWADVFAS